MPADAARSRTGCATCKTRKKKCDEQFSPAKGALEGALTCERCRLGSFECVPGTTVVRIKSRKERSGPVASTSRQDPEGMSVEAPSPPVLGGGGGGGVSRASSEGTARMSSQPTPISTPAPVAQPSPLSQAALDQFLAELNATAPLDEAGVLDSFGQSWSNLELPLVPLDNSGWETSDAGLDPAPVDFGSKHQFYNVLNESFFRSVPRVVRHALIQRVAALSASTALGEAASMAFVLMFKAKAQPEGAQARQDLLAQSDHYFQAAVAALGEEGLSLEAQLTAIADLQLCQLASAGAAAAYAIQTVAEFFIAKNLGPHPVLDMSNTTISPFMLHHAARMDVLQSLCLSNKRPTFKLLHLDESSASYRSHLGLPSALLVCLSDTLHLAADKSQLPANEVAVRADVIEMAVMGWQPTKPYESGLTARAKMDVVATEEMWRLAILVHLNAAVRGLGQLSTTMRDLLAELLSVGACLHRTNKPTDSTSPFDAGLCACPWFLAATLAILPDEQAQCRAGLEACGPQRVLQDNRQAIELYWQESASTGFALGWKDFFARRNLFIGFF